MSELSDHLDKVEETITIFVSNLKIVGHMHRHPDVRFSDEWNREHRDFVPLTDCTITDRSTDETANVQFVMVCRDHVDVIYPESGGGRRILSKEAQEKEPEEQPAKSVLKKRLRRIRPT